MGKATKEALALAAIQEIGLNPLLPLLASTLVSAALGRMLEPKKKSAGTIKPQQFWTSRSMPLRLDKDELNKLDVLQDVVYGSRAESLLVHPPLSGFAFCFQGGNAFLISCGSGFLVPIHKLFQILFEHLRTCAIPHDFA